MRRLLPLALVTALACGGAPPRPAQPAPLPMATTAQSGASPSVDLSPVPMPGSMAVFARLSSASRSLDTLGAWVGTTLDGHEPLAEVVGARLAKLVDLDAPIDLAVLFHPSRHGKPDGDLVLSVPVRSLDDAKAEFSGRLVPLPNGAFELLAADGKDGDEDGPHGEFRACALSPSAGGSGARVVCARHAQSRDEAMPYLVRGAPRQSWSSDVHVELRSAPFASYVEKNRGLIPMLARMSVGPDVEVSHAFEAAFGDLADMLSDIDRVSLDGTLDPNSGALEAKATFHGASALVTRALTGHPERAEALPAAFLRLPSDSDVAFFGHGMDADQLARPRDLAMRSVADVLQQARNLKAPDQKAFADAFGHTVDLLAYPYVYARGVDVAPAAQAVAKANASPGDATKAHLAYEAIAGWDVLGTQAPKGAATQVLKEWQAAFSRPSAVKWLKQQASRGDRPPVFKLARVPSGLPAGTVHLEVDVFSTPPTLPPAPPVRGKKAPPRRKPVPIVTELHVLAVPDGDTTWVVSALDEALAAAKARAMLRPAAGGTLESRSGLEALRGVRLNAGGFLSMRGIGMKNPFTWAISNPAYALDDDPLLGMSSSAQGGTPLPFTFVESAKDAEKSFTLGLRIPRSALPDLMNVGSRIFR